MPLKCNSLNLINRFYGKSMENIRKRTYIKLINDQKSDV